MIMDKKIKIGDSIKIIEMVGEPNYTLKTGVIIFIDDIGQLFGSWRSLAVNPKVDKFEVIKTNKKSGVVK